MEPFGQYTITVGEFQVPSSAELAKVSVTPVGDWNVSGQTEIRSYSEWPPFRSLNAPNLLLNPRSFLLKIVDADDATAIEAAIGDANMFLSVDVDYSGTWEHGNGSSSRTTTAISAERELGSAARHRQLIDRFAAFYQQFKSQIRSVSVANSPGYTVDEESRKPVADISPRSPRATFKNQPQWVPAEWDRVADPAIDSSHQFCGRC